MADGSVLLPAMAGKRKVVGFAGGGGSSEAIRLALNCDPDVAMNHWMTAVLAHQRHFPNTDHYCADIFDVDPRHVLPGDKIAFAWFSPDCTDFSKAKGKAPKSERIRGLIWSVIPWLVFRRPDVVIIENVEEFEQAGPVYRCEDDWRADGVPGEVGQPIPSLRGRTFQRVISMVRKMGGAIEWRVVNSADFGAPTTRKRLYVIIRLDGQPIVWPERTHAPRKEAAALGLKPWRGACEIIDFSQDCPSIFLTPEEVEAYRRATGKRINRPLVKATMKRIALGTKRHVIGAAEPFIVQITQRNWAEDRAHGVRDPLRTITSAKGGEFALASSYLVPRYRPGQAPRSVNVGAPLPTPVPTGNQGSLAAVSLHQLNTRDIGSYVAGPLRTIAGREHQALQAAHLVRQFGTGIAHDVRDPDGAATAEGIKTQLVTAYMAQGNGEQLGRAAVEPVSTLTGRATQQQLVAASLDSYYSSGSIGADPSEPMRTSTGKARHSLIAAWLEQANTDMVGHELPAPVSTIVGKGCTQRLIEARLELDGGPVGRRAAVLEFLWSHFGVPTAEEWADPTGTLQARLKFGIVLFDGWTWLIVDIGLRMLTPAELTAAMGLPASFDLTVDAHGEPISKTAQTQMIGNMVSPPPAAALIAANCPDLIEPAERKAA